MLKHNNQHQITMSKGILMMIVIISKLNAIIRKKDITYL